MNAISLDRDKPLPEELLKVFEDPRRFIGVCWPHLKLYDKQWDALYSVRDNQETFVHAGNELGKDFLAALCVLYFFCSRSPCRVVTSSSGETQLKSVLWGEMRQRIMDSKVPLGLDVKHLYCSRLLPDGKVDPMSYILGHVTKTVENFQGHHLDHDKPRILCLFDEASGVGDEFYEAAQSWAHRILAIGNPLNVTNFFYRVCKRGDVADPTSNNKLVKVIHIGAEHSPNVRVGREMERLGLDPPYPSIVPGVISYDALKRREVLWDKIKQHTRLGGHFYEGEEALMFPPFWLDQAERVYKLLNPAGYETRDGLLKEISTRKFMGVDGAAGRDLTCWTVITREGVIEQKAFQTPDTSKIALQTIQLIQQYRISPDDVCFDYGGGGKQIADDLRTKGFDVRTVGFGEVATPPKDQPTRLPSQKEEAHETRQQFKNRRAEMYWYLRLLIDPSVNDETGVWFGIPEELYELRKELAVMPLWYDTEGKLFLPPKDAKPDRKTNPDAITIKKLIGRSPDRADSLVLAVFSLLVKRGKVAKAL